MKVFFDANVLLDWVLRREPTFQNSSASLRETIRLGHEAFVSASSVNDIHYVIRKALKDEALAREKTTMLLSLFRFAKVDEIVLNDAAALQGRDFEDDITVAAALEANADCIVTNNIKDFSSYAEKIMVFSPHDYLEYIKTL